MKRKLTPPTQPTILRLTSQRNLPVTVTQNATQTNRRLNRDQIYTVVVR